MNNQQVINEIALMKQHYVEAIKIADRLSKRFDEGTKRKEVLTDEWKANFIAKRNKRRSIK